MRVRLAIFNRFELVFVTTKSPNCAFTYRIVQKQTDHFLSSRLFDLWPQIISVDLCVQQKPSNPMFIACVDHRISIGFCVLAIIAFIKRHKRSS